VSRRRFKLRYIDSAGVGLTAASFLIHPVLFIGAILTASYLLYRTWCNRREVAALQKRMGLT
jgi:hypothetical protein